MTTPAPVPPSPIESPPSGEMEDPFRKYEKDWFKQEFENIDRIAEEISMETSEGPTRPEGIPLPEDAPSPQGQSPLGEGIKIKEIATASVFKKIGLKNGDVIRDVNGQLVKTKEEFIKALQKASEDQTMIRIERTNETGMMNPIYIELNSPDSPDSQPAP